MIAVPLELVGVGIDEFCNLVNAGVEAWVEAGQVLCRLKEKDPDVFAVILAANPAMSQDILVVFERIGRRELYPYLLLDSSPGCLMLSTLPYEEQRELYHGGVPVVVKKGGFTQSALKKVSQLTRQEASRVFGEKRVRTVAEQTNLVQKEQGQHQRSKETASESKDEPEAESSELLAGRLACAVVQGFTVCRPQGTAGSAVLTILNADDARVAISQTILAAMVVNSLDEDPKATLTRLLTVIQTLLLEARGSLALIKKDSKFDKYISDALSSVGHLRFNLTNGGITR